MKNKALALIGAVAAGLIATSARADSASGPGGNIPASGTGDGTWATVLPSAPFVSSVNLAGGVASVQSIVMNVSIAHTWLGDLHAVLVAPNGTGYNIFVRPGSTSGSLGNSGDWTVGSYTFVDPIGGGSALPTVGNATPGTYIQSYDSWTSGNFNYFNTGMNSITGGAGTWSLKIYDWAGGDSGALSGWTINYTPLPAPGALALLGLSGMTLGGRRRRR
jgi:subtilisin-like proprotein convertase family protein